MAIKFTPRIECNLSIDQKVNDSAPLRYTIHLVGNISNQYLEIYGLDDESKQQRINKNLNEMVEEKVNLIMNPKEGEPETEDPSLLSIIYSANDKELIIKTYVVYSYVGFEKSYSKEFLIKINLLNGEVDLPVKYIGKEIGIFNVYVKLCGTINSSNFLHIKKVTRRLRMAARNRQSTL